MNEQTFADVQWCVWPLPWRNCSRLAEVGRQLLPGLALCWQHRSMFLDAVVREHEAQQQELDASRDGDCEWPVHARRCARGADGEQLLGLDLCWQHGKQLREEIQRAALHDRGLWQEALAELRKEEFAERSRKQHEQARSADVYYVQRTDGLIKIGWSGNLRSRLNTLRREHGHLTLLATHSGGVEAEAAQHKRFAHLRETGEWFWPEPDLLAHIERINDRRPIEAAS